MEREPQSASARLIAQYRELLPYTSFYRFGQLLEQSLPDAPVTGSSWQVRQEPVRFRPHPGMGFPAGEIRGAEAPEHPHLPPSVRINFMGLYGVESPLPSHYIDDIAQQREGYEATADFLDIFNHRLIAQYYRIWRKYSYPATFKAGGQDRTSQYLLGLAGLGISGCAQNIATPVSRFLALLPVMLLPGRTAEGLVSLVRLLAPGTQGRVWHHDRRRIPLNAPVTMSVRQPVSLKGRPVMGDHATDVNGQVLLQLSTGDAREAQGWLRDELSKLTHPARPDVNWQYVEKLCLSLFEQNGIELQTVAWYTLARTQLAGLPGLNEGLAILEALISHQWGTLWPQPVHARMEILSGLSQRLQQLMRTLSLNYSDLSQLYQAEQQLTTLGEVLQRLELKHLSQLDTLRTLMHNSAVRLENSHDASEPGVVIQHPSVATGTFNHAAPESPVTAKTDPVRWVYVAQPEPQSNVDVVTALPKPVKPWGIFAAGMCTMLVAGAAAVWGWQHFNQPDPQEQQLLATLAPLPAMLTPAQRDAARQSLTSPESFIKATQQQLIRLDALPPDWNIAYSRQLVEQAQALWPKLAESMALRWQQQLNASALPTENLEGWHQGMTKLKQLSDRLNGLDEQKGKYMTVSELKSVVFSTMQSFNQAIPAEEQLRVLAKSPAGQPLPVAASAQTEMHLKQLTTRYSEIKQKASDK